MLNYRVWHLGHNLVMRDGQSSGDTIPAHDAAVQSRPQCALHSHLKETDPGGASTKNETVPNSLVKHRGQITHVVSVSPSRLDAG